MESSGQSKSVTDIANDERCSSVGFDEESMPNIMAQTKRDNVMGRRNNYGSISTPAVASTSYLDIEASDNSISPRALMAAPTGASNISESNDMDSGLNADIDVLITQSANDMLAQTLPEGLRHVMLHVIGSRPSEEVKFRRLKYRLEGEGPVIQDNPFLPRGHRVTKKYFQPQIHGLATVSRQNSHEQSSLLTGQHSREESHISRQDSQTDLENHVHVHANETEHGQGTSRRQKGILVVLALNDMMASMALSILAPFFPKEVRNKNISDATSGWIFGVFALVQCLTSPLFGMLLPRIGAKFLSQSGQFFAGGCTMLFGMLEFVSTEDDGLLFIVYCFVLRIFMALGCAANGTAAFAIAARTFPDNPATVFGLLETAVGFGLMMGPALGGVLYEVGGFVAPFSAIGCAMVLSVPIGLYILPKDVIEEKTGDNSETSVLEFLRIPAISLTAIAAFIACLAWVMPDPTLEPHLSKFSLSPTVIGLVFLLMSACYAICSPVWGWVADNVPDSSPMMVIGFVGTGIGFLLLGPSPLFGFHSQYSPFWLNIISLIVIGLMVSLALVPTYDKILDAAEKAGIEDTLANCSTLAGIWNAAYSFGEFVGPVVAGWMMGKVGFGWTMSLASALCFIMGFAMLILYIYECRFGPTGTSSKKNNTPTGASLDEQTPLLLGV